MAVTEHRLARGPGRSRVCLGQDRFATLPSPEEFDALIRNDIAVFSKIAREANIKAE